MAGKSRTLVFSFDGTGNEPSDATKFEEDESISNVLKLHILMGGGLFGEDRTPTETPKKEPQRTYYYNGIGTREDGDSIPLIGHLVSKAMKFINATIAPTFGDARRILNEAMRDLEGEKPTEQDRIVIFGFSRGAALARKFSSMVLRNFPNLSICFLGVYDTVAAMDGIHRENESISSDVLFEHGTLNSRIHRAVHIVSLDEDRITFEPTLINLDKPHADGHMVNTSGYQVLNDRITEIWFSGVHSDIGGGYWHDGLADASLTFMIDECKEALREDIFIENSDPTKIRKLITEQGDILSLIDVDDILIHPNVTGMVHRHSSGLGKFYPKTPRRVCVNENDRPIKVSPNGLKADPTRPLVHHSVKSRFDLVAEYRPAALRGVEFNLLGHDGEVWAISGISGLREHDKDGREREQRLGG